MESLADRCLQVSKRKLFYTHNHIIIFLNKNNNAIFVSGVNILELILSIFCITTVLLLLQTSSSYFISYVLFLNPIKITNGMFVYVLLLLLLGWIGFLFGKYLIIDTFYTKNCVIISIINYCVFIIQFDPCFN